MPHFCSKCGADTYLCQVCHRAMCSREYPSIWRPDITGHSSAGNVCPSCVKKAETLSDQKVNYRKGDLSKRDIHLASVVQRMPVEAIALTCACINKFGTGQHPWADKESLPYFMKDYVMECITKGLNSNLFTDEGIRILSRSREDFQHGK